MYIITNRRIDKHKNGLRIFSDKPNTNGAQELTMVKVNKKGGSWVARPVTDKLSPAVVKDIKKKYRLDIDVRSPWHGSLKVACELFEEAVASQKNILFFVHGYNNDVRDVIKAAEAIENLYDVIVVPFTWPANGGNPITGAASYLSDKADARQSTSALNRMVGKLAFYHRLLTKGWVDKLRMTAYEKHPNNPAAARELFTRLQARDCKIKISLLCHSMGNYVLKHTLMTGDSLTKNLVFDNVCLVAADTNNKDHKRWVDRLDVRNRCYIVINENDSALSASRIKPGDEQLARLGHYTRKLNSECAYYIDVTSAKGVDTEHTYFKGNTVKVNAELRAIFAGMFRGRAVEGYLDYRTDKNLYVMRGDALIENELDELFET
ncbi:MAG TPA: alpha/beta hydrolase [Gammaproteobacteria bacterium]|nr:alpha/beta hydrolase [Gammaproteobacteria bacterium]